jgi:hypothetical protein
MCSKVEKRKRQAARVLFFPKINSKIILSNHTAPCPVHCADRCTFSTGKAVFFRFERKTAILSQIGSAVNAFGGIRFVFGATIGTNDHF